MYFNLLTDKDMGAIDALIESYGGAKEIGRQVTEKRDYQTRKKITGDKGFGSMLEEAEGYAKNFAKVEDFIAAEKINVNKPGVCITQVSGFQGSRVTLDCMRRVAQNRDVLFPTEMISVVALTEHYVYSGDLLATLAMAENILGASKFCSTNLIGIPLRITVGARGLKEGIVEFKWRAGRDVNKVTLDKAEAHLAAEIAGASGNGTGDST